ncbi:type 1 glutamine amidotransferase [Roseibacterium sp. SDUM158017]|uniref:type 1 glutamine amidotransferase n=1 Tax=Roseicyclus salinarum TaxID=3036773 RepID=UPI002415585A|nr:type 1 glutamine amidotransferase [Roseibacterium sp. SDUM158017]MDG4649124.1 type 1 glutamine amidotransferase [Roseibacterium sp. SDUM158017]
MIIGILQTGHLPEAISEREGEYSDMFQRLLGGRGFEFRVFNVVDMEFPDGHGAADAWLITGSRHGAYEDLPWIAPLEELIRGIRDADKPLVGICFGHQIVAQALGGKVVKFPGGWALGLRRYRIGDAEVQLHAWHQDQVVELPEGATVLGRGDATAYAMLAVGERILTIQPHPEFERPVVEGLIEHRGGAIEPTLVAAAAASLDARNDNAAIGRWMGDVLQGAPATRVPEAITSTKAEA